MIIATSTPKKFELFSVIIKWYQGTNFSHVLIIDGDLVYQASHLNVNCWYLETFTDANTIISSYNVPDSTVDMEFVKEQLGKGYGIGQIFDIAWKVITGIKLKGNGDKKFICSEYVGKALRLPWVDDYTTPEDIDEYLKKFEAGVK